MTPSRRNALLFDLAIVLLIALGGLTAWLCFSLTQTTDSAALGTILMIIGSLGAIGSVLTFYGSLIEPRLIVINRKTVTAGLPRKLTIVIASDFHCGTYKGKRSVHRIVKKINKEKPDLILLPGDFVDAPWKDITDLAFLKHLRAPLGVFGVFGNHDVGHFQSLTGKPLYKGKGEEHLDGMKRKLESYGVQMLRNRHRVLKTAGGTIAVAGVEDVWTGFCDYGKALEGIPKDVPVILMIHNPEGILDPTTHRANLIVSGHTHGGQIRLPLIGPLSPIPDKLGRAYDQGIFTLSKNRILAITHGCGETLARARLFCPPEILVLETR